jgi:hypothetical protein
MAERLPDWRRWISLTLTYTANGAINVKTTLCKVCPTFDEKEWQYLNNPSFFQNFQPTQVSKMLSALFTAKSLPFSF